MYCSFRSVCIVLAIGVGLGTLSAATFAGTIIKLGMGGDTTADIKFDGTTLSTVNDLNAVTIGDQDTGIDYQGFLSGETDIISPPASFSMSGLTPASPAAVIGGVLVIQDFTGGTFSLYDDTNVLLLSGTLGLSTLAGPLGPPATGALFTTSFATIIPGGLLDSQIDPTSLTLSMSLTAINGAGGFTVSGAAAPLLNPFTADVTLNIAADPIPEPTTTMLLILGTALVGVFAKQRA